MASKSASKALANNNNNSKGQTKLFSFFKKPESTSSTPRVELKAFDTETRDISETITIKPNIAIATPGNVASSDSIVSELNFNSSSTCKVLNTLISEELDMSVKRPRYSINYKEDDEDVKANSKKIAKRIIIDDEDKEWDCPESDGDVSTEFSVDDDVDDICLDRKATVKSKRLNKSKDNTKSRKVIGETSSGNRPPLPHSASKPKSNSVSRNSSSVSSSVLSSPGVSQIASSIELHSIMSGNSHSDGELKETLSGCNVILPEGVLGRGSHEHNSFAFLKPENRQDKNRKRINELGYNPRTLYLPESFLKDQTPAMKQWWQFKCENMDTVLFFKVGKFYELFHMDADIGMEELDLIYMKGAKAHSGFPEVSYGKFASQLVAKGYRVARVEQTETPEMLKDRNESSNKKKEKVVRRELCSVMSKGTRTYCHLDDLSLLDDNVNTNGSSLLVSIHERQDTATDRVGFDLTVEYGICCIDTVLGNVFLAQFQDDKQRNRLRTFLLRYPPSELILHDSMKPDIAVNADLHHILRTIVPKAVYSYYLTSDYSPMPQNTIKMIADNHYFHQFGQYPAILKAAIDCYVSQSSINCSINLGKSQGDSDLLLTALGGSVWLLKRSLIDYEILSLGKIFAYIPPDEQQSHLGNGKNQYSENSVISTAMDTDDDTTLNLSCNAVKPSFIPASVDAADSNLFIFGTDDTSLTLDAQAVNGDDSQKLTSMTLDATALANLEVLVNNYDHTEKGSLWGFINRCKTSFGKRLLRSWLCHPLYQPSHIAIRAAAVEEVLTNELIREKVHELVNLLKAVPDLERLLARVHSNGINRKMHVINVNNNARNSDSTDPNSASQGSEKVVFEEHPDSRAVMYESQIYNSRKIKDFADIISGFETLVKIGKWYSNKSVQSKLLFQITQDSSSVLKINSENKSLCTVSGKLSFKEMEKLLQHYREIFDEKEAKKEGFIRPKPGADADYDAAKHRVLQIENEFEQYLRDIKKQVNINDIKYFGSNKDRYQLEVPMSIASTNKIPSAWTTKSQKKTHRRYWTSWIESKLEQLVAAEDNLSSIQNDTIRRVFAKFDEKRHLWIEAVNCIAMLDAIYALAEVSNSPGYVWPSISLRSSSDSGPIFQVVNGRHPMLEFSLSQRGDGNGYIPNTVELGGSTIDLIELKRQFLPKLLLLTGPNMGGKSTLLRQTCLITILAQIGCKVPADSCTLTAVDRIFTRVGASDRILSGQSTFFVELAETALVLKYATQDSICILDELGRGTATFDGTAIAHSVIDHLLTKNQSRILFATHYHSLINDWEMDPRVKLGHMDCVVDTDNTGEDSVSSSPVGTVAGDGDVTFLYKLCNGSSPNSYGINVAKLAGLPKEVIEIAMTQSQEFEARMKAQLNTADCRSAISANKVLEIYFDRLVSIVHSEMSELELAYAATEIWNRLKSKS